jgi:phosphatidate cytidylyltransferase
MADVIETPPVSNTLQRIITALIGGPLVLFAVLAGGIPFALVVLFGALVGVIEFYHLAQNRPSRGSNLVGIPIYLATVLAFYFGEPRLLIAALGIGTAATFLLELIRQHNLRWSLTQTVMTLAGILYVGFPAGFLVSLRALPGENEGVLWVLLILFVTWGTDSLAYVGGRLWGKTPLAPTLSPKKTREGAVVGVVGGVIPALILLALTHNLSTATLVFIVIGPFIAILGDLFESALKRFFGIKDSHVPGLDILPGHGGILDRIDALLFVTALAYLVYLLFGGSS